MLKSWVRFREIFGVTHRIVVRYIYDKGNSEKNYSYEPTKANKTSYIIIYHHISSYIIIYHHISSHIIIYHQISSNIIKYHHISSYIIIYHHISSHIIIYHQISSYIIKYHHISSYIITYHHMSSYIITYHHISSYIIIYHHISSYIIIYHHIYLYIIYSIQLSSNSQSWLSCALTIFTPAVFTAKRRPTDSSCGAVPVRCDPLGDQRGEGEARAFLDPTRRMRPEREWGSPGLVFMGQPWENHGKTIGKWRFTLW